MKRTDFILFLIFLFGGIIYYFYFGFSSTGDAVFNSFHANVSRIVDGDTIQLSDFSKVRLLGINTPEKGEFYSAQSIEYISQILNKTVSIEFKEKDKYGRILGYVFVEDKFLNEEILSNGFAHFYSYQEDKYSTKLRRAENFARENNLGIWGKSGNFGCLKINSFNYLDVDENDFEELVLENLCSINLSVLIKDDATHLYHEKISAYSIFTKKTQNVWNDNGDSLFVWGSDGLILFYRYA